MAQLVRKLCGSLTGVTTLPEGQVMSCILRSIFLQKLVLSLVGSASEAYSGRRGQGKAGTKERVVMGCAKGPRGGAGGVAMWTKPQGKEGGTAEC